MNITSRLLIVSYATYPSYNGYSRRIDGILASLASENVQIEVLCPLFNKTKPKSVYSVPINYLYIPGFERASNRKIIKLVRIILFSVLASVWIVRHHKNSIIQYQQIFSAFPAITSKLFRKNIIVGDDIILAPGRGNKPPILYFSKLYDWIVLHVSDVIVTASPLTFNYLKNKGMRKGIYVTNGIFDLDIERKRDKRQNRIYKLFFIGSFRFPQNIIAIQKLFFVARKLKKKRKDFRIIIVGGPCANVGNMMNNNLVKKQVIMFTGFLSDDELDKMYREVDIGLLPFFEDTKLLGGNRIKALEFLSYGLLVFSGPEGVKYIDGLKEGVHYIGVKSVGEMVEKIDCAMTDFSKFDEIRSEGMKIALSNYLWKNVTKNYIKTISLLSGKRLAKNTNQNLKSLYKSG